MLMILSILHEEDNMESNKGINLREAEIIKFSDISRKIRRKTIKLAYVSEYAHPDT